MKRLIIIGAGGHGRVVADAATLMNEWTEIVFFDDAYSTARFSSIWPIIGNVADAESAMLTTDDFVVAVGNAKVRQAFFIKFSLMATPVSIVHPSAIVSPRISIGRGCVVMAGAVLCIGVRLDDGVIVNTGSTVDHDCRLSAFSHVCPGANVAGDVIIGERTWVGIGSCVKQGLQIGNDVIIGAGTVVISNTPNNVTIVGNPARVLVK